MLDPELERYQKALAEHLVLGRDPGALAADPALEPWRAYVDSFEPHLVDLTQRLAVIWLLRGR